MTAVTECCLKRRGTGCQVSRVIARAVDVLDCPRRLALGPSCADSGRVSSSRSRLVYLVTILSCDCSVCFADWLDLVSYSLVVCPVVAQTRALHCRGISLRNVRLISVPRAVLFQRPSYVAAVVVGGHSLCSRVVVKE